MPSAASSLMVLSTISWLRKSRLDSGSSSISSPGSAASARAMSTICNSPPLISEQRLPRSLPMPRRSITSSQRFTSELPGRANMPMRPERPMSMVSSTV